KYHFLILFCCSLGFLTGFIYYFYQMLIAFFPNDYLASSFGAFFFFIFFIILFWLGFQFFGSYLKIYSDGISVRKPYRLYRHKFIPWSSIKDVHYAERGALMDLDLDLDLDFAHEYNSVHIYLKDEEESIEITNVWVEQIYKAYEIMKENIEPYEQSNNCQYHPNIKVDKKCLKCGKNVCSACIEEKTIFTTYFCECSLCSYKKGLKRIWIIYAISLFLPLIMILNYISSFYMPPRISLISPQIDASPMFIFFLGVSITPLGYGNYLAHIKRKIILNKLGLTHPTASFVILGLLSIFLISFSAFLFYYVNEYLLLVFEIWTGIYILIVYGYNYPRKYVYTTPDHDFNIKKTRDRFDILFFIIFFGIYLGLLVSEVILYILGLFLAKPEIDKDILWLIIKHLHEQNLI
ncbi:MAG: hypothetical protein ACFFDN_13920, partial [Candidatus Hodarchaeota archaeon]